MKKFIIHPNPDTPNQICLVCPAEDCNIALEEIARKDVPAGLPFKFIDEADIPREFDYFAAYEADFSKPDGYGIGQEAWIIEQEAKLAK
jgi:hypothetical protein